MGFLGIVKNAANRAYNTAKTTKNNIAYTASYMDERKIHVKGPAGYVNKGTYKPGETALRYAINRYKRDGYQVVTVDAINGYKQRVSVLFIKANKAAKAKVSKKVTVKARTAKAVRSKRTSKAKKTIPKYLEIAGKRYEKAGTFGGYQDNAKAYASDLKRQGFAVRVKKLIINLSMYLLYILEIHQEEEGKPFLLLLFILLL